MQSASIAFEEKFLRNPGQTRDVLLKSASKVLEYNTPFLPESLRITNYDYARAREFDDFNKAVQLHREQYKNADGTIHPLSYFRTPDTDDPTKSYLCKYPVTYVKYKNPPVLPRTYARALKLPPLPERKNPGIHNRSPCTAYKF
ncbi:uncharacterized protein LOC107048132 [Diachasma alloeum]|uniref:uncharacterized protein LOC107048132 n=1 Tax=Diachasma alloeum TaxID=454923 RepID=UPI000738203E|nr:uncharacterized protein LOC107048132 [Diachasma alloeum]